VISLMRTLRTKAFLIHTSTVMPTPTGTIISIRDESRGK